MPPSFLRVRRGFLKKRNQSNSFRMPFFSVIIPAFNRLPYLMDALGSVLGQSFHDYELIIVDDGSTDGTQPAILEMLKSGDSEPLKFKYLRQENAGPGAARNLGARNAKGEYLAFLDSDDLWFPWTLEVCHQVIMKSQFPSIVSAKLVEFVQKVELGAILKSEVEFESFADYFQSAAGSFYVGAGMLFIKKICFDGSGGFTEKRINLEDHDLVLKCGESSGFAAITSPATLAWRRHQGSLTKIDKKSIEGSNFIIQQEKHGNYPGGSARKNQRIQIICSHVRAVSMGALAAGHSKAGWSLFWKCLAWNVLLRRWKYVFGFPIKALSN
jgi:GT2 family glycosyltransferase